MDIILKKIVDYVKLKDLSYNNKTKFFICPKCNSISCNITPNNNVQCFKCGKLGDIFSLVRLVEKDKKTYPDSKILSYLKELFNLDILTEKERVDIFQFYEEQGFDLVPVVYNGKAPVESGWTTKNHKTKNEWLDWLDQGLNIGIKTGEISGITVIDIDTHDLPEEVTKLFNKTSYQKTNKGIHYFYKYCEELPKTRIDKYKIDIENNGGQVVSSPSTIDGVTREFVIDGVAEMSDELKKFLLDNVSKRRPKQTYTEQLKQGMNLEDFKIEGIGEGNRTNALMHLGGIFRKKLNKDDCNFCLEVFNSRVFNPPLSRQEFNNVIASIDKYDVFDKDEITSKILSYLRIVEEATARDVREALGFEKQVIDTVLALLSKKEYIVKKRRMYKIVKKIEWKDTFMDEGKAVPYKLPYFHNHAIIREGDMIIIGGNRAVGKTHAAMNIVKDLVDQNIKPHYICLEAGSRFVNVAKQLGLKEGDFNWCINFSPDTVELEKSAVTIIDWLLPKDYSETDKICQRFAEQLVKNGGVLIVFVQIRQNGEFFAGDMLEMFPAIVSKFLYNGEPTDPDYGIYSRFELTKIREPRFHKKSGVVPCRYDAETRKLIDVSEEM